MKGGKSSSTADTGASGEFWRALLTIVLSIIVFFGLAEIVLRFLPVAGGLWAMPVTPDNPIFHFMPNRPFIHSWRWDFALVNRGRTNNDGWINDQDYRKDDRTPLLAVIGDSYIQAVMVPYADTLQGRIAKAFENKLRVYSFAAAGAPLSQYLIWARYAVQQYGATALVINVVGNDFDESHVAYSQHPGYWIYVPDSDGRLRLHLFEFHPGVARSIVRNSALARYLFINLQLNRIDFSLNGLRALGRGRQDDQMRYAGNTSADLDPARVNASLEVIDAFFRDLRDFVGVTPDRVAFTLDGFRYPEAAAKGGGTYFAYMRRIFRERALGQGFEVIDLDAAFFAHFEQHHEAFEYPDDAHWNATAHGVVADAVLSSPLLERLRSEGRNH